MRQLGRVVAAMDVDVDVDCALYPKTRVLIRDLFIVIFTRKGN